MIGEDVRTLGDRLAGLSVAAAAGLSAYLKDAYGIVAPRATIVPRDGIPDDGDIGMYVPPTADVVLANAGPKKIGVIKVVRQITGLGLKEAKDLVDGAPKVVKAGIYRAEAEKLRDQLVAEGASVELKF